MDETIFCHKINNPMLLGNLHGSWEVIRGLRWEIDIDSFLNESRVGSGMVNFHNV